MCTFVKTMAVRISLKVFGGSCSPVPFKFQIKIKIMKRCKASSIAYLLTAVKPTLKLRITSPRFWAPEKDRDKNAKQPPHFIAWMPMVETWPKAQQAESTLHRPIQVHLKFHTMSIHMEYLHTTSFFTRFS